MNRIYYKKYKELDKWVIYYGDFLGILFILLGFLRKSIPAFVLGVVVLIASNTKIEAFIDEEGFHKEVSIKSYRNVDVWQWKDITKITYQYIHKRKDLVLLYIEKGDRTKKVYFGVNDLDKVKNVACSANSHISIFQAKDL